MKLKNYREIQTEDGSTTLFSRVYNEACHSESGAVLETNLHYIQACKIPMLAKTHKEVFVLEVGFGAGIGFEQTLQCFENAPSKLNFTSFEIDEDLILYFLEKNNLSYSKSDSAYIVTKDNFELCIFYGDARESIHLIENNKFHAIYQDAFSPRRNAILWTSEWFSDLIALADESCIMSTYSASSSIRKSMIAAGWKLYAGEKFGNKRASTRARLTGETDSDILLHLERSPVSAITDSNYKDYTIEDRK